MSEITRNIITTPSISKAARDFNNLAMSSTIQGMKTAAFLDRQIVQAEREQEESKKNPVIKEEPVPTGTEIRQAREEGEYR